MKNTYMRTRCKICGGDLTEFIEASDKMYNTDDKFVYGQCSVCHCLQCLDIPNDLSKFYPQNYYSFSKKSRTNFSNLKRKLKLKLIFSHHQFLNSFIHSITKNYEKFWTYKKLGISKSSKILDVGTGNGEHVIELIDAGFEQSKGVDPFIDSDLIINNKLIVKKSTLNGINEKFDLITFHHSLEHMDEQVYILQQAMKCLKPDGKILIRIPTVSSQAFRTYKENWFQLDAPRHLFLHSHKSLNIAAMKAGLRIKNLWCDSNELQFVISDEYANGIYGNSSLSFFNDKKSIRHKELMKKMKPLAKEVNAKLDGDQICAILEIENEIKSTF